MVQTAPALQLNTGALLPAIGLGTWKSGEEDTYNAVKSAIAAGYRHIDTAAIYGNESAVGRAIRDSGVPREDLWITTKLFSTQHRNPKEGLEGSLERLGLDYVDLYLMHWPVALKADKLATGHWFSIPLLPDGRRDIDVEDWDFVKTWRLMQELPKSGKCRNIGVSNFSINNLKKLSDSEDKLVVPAVNQIEIHPQLPQTELIDFCKARGIVIEAYSPLGSSDSAMLTHPVLVDLAKKYDAQPANVLINWGLSRGYCVLPKSINAERIKSNFRQITVSDEDIELVTHLIDEVGAKRYVQPDWRPWPIFE
ncbi:hypothetical protein HG536_0E05900 [Torulaspora globosa]|uniref:NADP-dependent oxidoreductase domain-containing protein n=1 Tax=Torulaspora globosa TaxID=48254 RepID=A0A7G3ZJJ2_9SACH|nr:uncharacterized protein HG536_0E05900 [Torulaspora globosa]QLL33678.1 hypothetical protein HG536_0E05900 [Torulaspora globosa]